MPLPVWISVSTLALSSPSTPRTGLHVDARVFLLERGGQVVEGVQALGRVDGDLAFLLGRGDQRIDAGIRRHQIRRAVVAAAAACGDRQCGYQGEDDGQAPEPSRMCSHTRLPK